MEMRRYILKVLCFITPVAVVFLAPLLVLWGANEFREKKEVLNDVRSGRYVLLGNAYVPCEPVVMDSISELKPEVITLGNSRVLEFRREFFNTSFFNGGGTISSIQELKDFLERLPAGYNPKLIIIGLDQRYFAPGGLPHATSTSVMDFKKAYLSVWPKIYKDYFAGKFKLSDLSKDRNKVEYVGMNALANRNGLREDGSYYYGQTIAEYDATRHERLLADALERVEKERNPGESLNPKAVEEMEVLLRECAARGIKVAGFLAPYPHAVFEKMSAKPESYGYMTQLEPVLKPVFAKYDFPFMDFSDLDSLGGSADEYVDGLHGSEKAYLRIWIKLAESDKFLAGLTDLGLQKQRLNQAVGPLEVYPSPY